MAISDVRAAAPGMSAIASHALADSPADLMAKVRSTLTTYLASEVRPSGDLINVAARLKTHLVPDPLGPDA